MTTVINLFGGPGVGKSTTAAGTFFLLKRLGYNSELVQEYAKDAVWEERFKVLDAQPLILGKQFYRMFRLADKVDYIVTDSLIILTVIYNQAKIPHLDDLALHLFNQFSNINIFLVRDKPYQQAGRVQTEDAAKQLDSNIKDLLDLYLIPYHTVVADDSAPEEILKIIGG